MSINHNFKVCQDDIKHLMERIHKLESKINESKMSYFLFEYCLEDEVEVHSVSVRHNFLPSEVSVKVIGDDIRVIAKDPRTGGMGTLLLEINTGNSRARIIRSESPGVEYIY